MNNINKNGEIHLENASSAHRRDCIGKNGLPLTIKIKRHADGNITPPHYAYCIAFACDNMITCMGVWAVCGLCADSYFTERRKGEKNWFNGWEKNADAT